MSIISCFPSADNPIDSIPVRELTNEQYDALTEEEKQADVLYILPNIGAGAAAPAPAGGNVPSGGIIIWSGASDAVPEGWALCDGTNDTPDLRGRFILGESASCAHGTTGGEATHTLTESELPSHRHSVSDRYETATTYALNIPGSGSGSAVRSITAAYSSKTSGSAGENAAHNNMPPYYVLCFIKKL